MGQEQVTEALSNSLKQGKISHAYLFIGPRGTGKTSVARIFAHEVNGFKYKIEDDYVDIIEIDGASNRGIDNIRELREKVMIAPSQGKYKVYIIDEVHMLTKEAFNALLKTLEEPPEHVIFIMATTDAYKVPVTITSRAQTYTFKLAESKVMLEHLKSVAEKEGIKIDEGALEIIVKRGGGSFRDSLSLLDQISTLSDTEITKEMVVHAMGLPEDEKIAELLHIYTKGSAEEIAAKLKDLLLSGIRAETLTEEIINVIIGNPKPEYMELLERLTSIKEPFAEAKLLVALAADASFRNRTCSPEMSYAGAPAEPPAKQANLSGPSGIYISGRSNLEMVPEKTRPAAPKLKTPITTSSFDWDSFLEKMRNLSEVIYMQLKWCEHEREGNSLHLYPQKKMAKNILGSQKNKEVLVDAAGMKIVLHDVGGEPRSQKNDPQLAEISAIMGGKVQEVDNGGNPFE